MAFTPRQQMAHLRQRATVTERRLAECCDDPTGRTAIESLLRELERTRAERDEAREARDRERLRADREAERRKAAELAREKAERRADRHQRESERLAEENEGLRDQLRSHLDDMSGLLSSMTALQDDGLEWMRRALEAEKAVDAQRARLNRSPENSSRPPSSDPNRRKQERKKKKEIANSREGTKRKRGGQKGHRGHVRKYHRPDERLDVTPTGPCPCCGGELEPFGKASERHVTELYIVPFTKAYVGRKCRCGKCGGVARQEWPADAPNEENWGVTVKATLAVLCGWLNASIDKAREFLSDATHGEVDVSKGFVSNSMREFSGDAGPLLDAIERAVRGSPVAGCDATFTRTDGKTSYVYVFHSPEAAAFRGSATKGIEPLAGSPISGNDPMQVVCHDHDVSFYSKEVKAGLHAECNAHASRYLKGVCQNEPGRTWASEMRTVLGVAHDLAEECRAEGREPGYDELRGIALAYLAALDLADAEYLRDGPFEGKYKPEGIALKNRMREFIDEHLLFLLRPDVPFTNNGSERMLRCVKNKTKQSGGFRSEEGKQRYCDFLSVAKTAQLHGMGPLAAASAVFGSKGC